MTPPVDVAIVTRGLGYGGAQRQLATLAAALHRRAIAAVVVAMYPGGAVEAELDSLGVPRVCLFKRSRWHLVGPTLRAARWARAHRPKAVYGFMPDGNLLATVMWLASGGQLFWGIRESEFDLAPYGWLPRFVRWMALRCCRWPTAIIANSSAGAEDHVRIGYPRDRMVVIPNGIDTDRFRPAPENRGRVREQWAIAVTGPVIGMIARLDPVKDHRTFLAAGALIRERLRGVTLVIIGDGPSQYQAELEDEARNLGLTDWVRWVPAVPHVEELYCALDLVVLPSRSEGFANALGEAMASGVRCVATDAGDSADVIGDTGAVVPVGDVRGLADACLAMLSEQGGRLGDPRQRIIDRFSVARMVDATLEVVRPPAAALRQPANVGELAR